MPLSNRQAPDDRILIRYLIGSLPEEEAERLDEWSIADDAFASRLSAVEHDLVDAYVNGELAGDTLEGFRTRYLQSPSNRVKVEFAETFRTYPRATTPPARVASDWRWFAASRSGAQWGLAAAALLVVAATGYLLLDNLRLRNQLTNSRMARATLETRERDLQQHLNQQQSATNETAKELASVQESLAELERRAAATQSGSRRRTLAFTLFPVNRGAGTIATVAIPTGVDVVTLRLQLETDDFPRYRAALKASATDRVIWRSANLQAASSRGGTSLPMTLRASLFAPQTYTMELTGVPTQGPAELVGSYAFRVVIQSR